MRVQLVKRRTDKQLAKCIAPIMDRWLRRLDLYNTWLIRVEVVCEKHLPPATGDDSTVLAAITFNDPYRRATIVLNRRLAATVSDADMEHNLLHELVHVLMRPVLMEAESHVAKGGTIAAALLQAAHEAVTDTFTNLLLWDSKGERNR